MILTGHQPEYLPYIGFFLKMMLCDKFVIVDHVQFSKKSYQNRNKIRTQNGWTWLTVPVITKRHPYQKINEVRINDSVKWRSKHWKSIYFNYKKSPFFDEYQEFFENLYAKKWEKLVDLNVTIIRFVAEKLKIKVEMVKSSDINPQGKKTMLLIDMCKKLNADTYLSGEGARRYVNVSKFKEHNLNHVFRYFQHPVYHQQFTPFIPNMSVIDLMFNYSSDRVKEIIRSSGGVEK